MSRHAHLAHVSRRSSDRAVQASVRELGASMACRHGLRRTSVCVDIVVRKHAPPD